MAQKNTGDGVQKYETDLQISKNFVLDYQVKSINQLANVFEQEKAVYIIGQGIKPVNWVRNFRFSTLSNYVICGKMWTIKRQEPEVSGLKSAIEFISIIGVFAVICIWFIMALRSLLLFEKKAVIEFIIYTLVIVGTWGTLKTLNH